MNKECKNCGGQINSSALFCENCGSKIEKEESKIINLLMWLFPLYLIIISYISATHYFEDNSDYNLGSIIGAAITFTFIPTLVLLIRKLFKKKKLTEKAKVFLFYGVSIALFIITQLGRYSRNISSHLGQ